MSTQLVLEKPAAKKRLIEKLDKRTARVGIIGLGYVGLPLSLAYSERGYVTVGFDIDLEKAGRLNSGVSYIEHIPSEKITAAVESGFRATTDFSEVQKMDAIVLCVPTPLDKHREPDMRCIRQTMDELAPFLREGQVLSLESTTYPGTTEEEIRPRLESMGFTVGEDVFLVYSPEREDPGNPVFTARTIPKVLGGSTPDCLDVGKALYGQVIERLIPVGSTRVAEFTKLLENIQRVVNISLMNEMKMVADKMGIDIFDVIKAASSKPFGFVPYYPGPGIGGHCIPVDPFYLTWKAREFQLHTRFVELAGEINNAMPRWVVGKIADALNRKGKSIKQSRILVLGAAYKKNVDDLRESPALTLMEMLNEKEALVDYSDPHVPSLAMPRQTPLKTRSVPLTPEMIACYDCVVLATDHDAFDYSLIKKTARLIVDTRGRYEPDEKIFRA